jgi:hypothetical protein
MSKAAGVLAAEEREVDNNEEVCVYCQEPRDDKHSCCQENHFVQKKELTKEAVNPGLMAILKARQSAEKTKTLTNNQKKLDKNKNGKLDADDFKKLRKEAVENKDDREYGYEGDMVITQLKTLCRHADHLMNMLKPETDLPEWVQSKITLATDYIQTSHDYLMSEMNEETLDERNKANATMRKNMDASRGSKYKLNNPVPDASPEHKNARDHNKAIGRALRNEDKYAGLEKEDKPGKFTAGAKSNHTKGINLDTVEGWKDAKKPVKEEIEMEEKQISFTEFLQLNEMEFVNGRYVHKGTYGTAKGAKYGNTDYERDTLDSKEDESGSEPKRGRGRPKGAGSGARENLGKSKLHQGK